MFNSCQTCKSYSLDKNEKSICNHVCKKIIMPTYLYLKHMYVRLIHELSNPGVGLSFWREIVRPPLVEMLFIIIFSILKIKVNNHCIWVDYFLLLNNLLLSSFSTMIILYAGLSMNILRVGDKSPMQWDFFTNSAGDLLPAIEFLGRLYNFCNLVIIFYLM